MFNSLYNDTIGAIKKRRQYTHSTLVVSQLATVRGAASSTNYWVVLLCFLLRFVSLKQNDTYRTFVCVRVFQSIHMVEQIHLNLHTLHYCFSFIFDSHFFLLRFGFSKCTIHNPISYKSKTNDG